ncbi:MAG: hypothetical protein GXP46_00550 [Deferribacteres bacterium]|nr:hypothetical protein [Deferribacteres bacterium]
MKGFITEDHLRKALAEQMNSRAPARGGPRRLIGEILFEKGWIKNRQIRIVLDEQQRSGASRQSGKRELHTRSKREAAGSNGVILAGMTKRQVREILSSSQPRIWYTPGEQEVWFYKVPRKQNIYFVDDKVDTVKYLH